MITLTVTEMRDGVTTAVGTLSFHKDEVSCGRRSQCDLVYPYGNAASIQCYFTLLPDGLWLRDAGPTGGTFLNGARVRRARLTKGDKVYFGCWMIAPVLG